MMLIVVHGCAASAVMTRVVYCRDIIVKDFHFVYILLSLKDRKFCGYRES